MNALPSVVLLDFAAFAQRIAGSDVRCAIGESLRDYVMLEVDGELVGRADPANIVAYFAPSGSD